jgi:dienelactone hydrolase
MHRNVTLVVMMALAVTALGPRLGARQEGVKNFDTEWARLRAGRMYTKQPTGVRELTTAVGGTRLDNVLEVPAEYDPAKKWALRVQLHGGVGRPAPASGGQTRPLTPNRIPGEAQLTLQPRAWSNSQWWQPAQVDNVFALIERVKHDYNVDESRVYVTGISDGGTGVYYLAMRNATPWAACLPLNGHPSVLANPDTGVDGELFIGNLVNCPMYLVNGGRDRLYPAASVSPLVDMMKRARVPIVWQVYPEAGHDTSWWPTERARYEAFLGAHPRVAHPEQLSWETERVDRYNRVRWLIIDRLGKRPSDERLDDVNTFEPLPGRSVPLYDRSGHSGRVDIARQGNTFDAKSRGVQQFTVLLSPDVIDFDTRVDVTVNGMPAFSGMVKREPAVLKKWAERDNDRSMLYAAELAINVP